MIRIGVKARLYGLTPELHFANMILLAILIKHGAVMTLSHGLDGVHSRASIHYAGGAEDLVFSSTLEMTVKQQIFKELSESVCQDFDVLFESLGLPNEHFHIEWQPKDPYK